jgi:hypothetical protein
MTQFTLLRGYWRFGETFGEGEAPTLLGLLERTDSSHL